MSCQGRLPAEACIILSMACLPVDVGGRPRLCMYTTSPPPRHGCYTTGKYSCLRRQSGRQAWTGGSDFWDFTTKTCQSASRSKVAELALQMDADLQVVDRSTRPLAIARPVHPSIHGQVHPWVDEFIQCRQMDPRPGNSPMDGWMDGRIAQGCHPLAPGAFASFQGQLGGG